MDYIYPSFSIQVGVVFACSTVYGLWKVIVHSPEMLGLCWPAACMTTTAYEQIFDMVVADVGNQAELITPSSNVLRRHMSGCDHE